MNTSYIARKFSCAVGTLALLGTFVCSTEASIIIDDFTNVGAPNPWPINLTNPGSTTVFESGLNVLGGTRESYIELTATGIPDLDFLQVTIAAGAGLLDYNSTVDADGFISMLYNGGGSLNADFSSLTGIEFEFSMFDFADSAPLPVSVILSDGANTATHSLSLNAPGPQLLFFAFNEFSDIGLLDLASIQSVKFELDPAIGADFRLGRIAVIPAPGAMALLGLAGFVGTRRRRS